MQSIAPGAHERVRVGGLVGVAEAVLQAADAVLGDAAGRRRRRAEELGGQLRILSVGRGLQECFVRKGD